MNGPRIYADTLSVARVPDKFGNVWQYHSRSDRHSKIACWAIAFDLLANSEMLREHASQGRVTFGVNHTMVDFSTGRKKALDLVLAGAGAPPGPGTRSLTSLAAELGIRLTEAEASLLDSLPPLTEAPVTAHSVRVALEAKACMTEHNKSRPRLYDELTSSHQTVHGDTDTAIAVGFVTVNASETFVSSDRNKWPLDARPAEVTKHNQPAATLSVIDKIRELPRSSGVGKPGYDALGLTVIDMANNGSPVKVVSGPPAPLADDSLSYESMVNRVVHLYESRWGRIS